MLFLDTSANSELATGTASVDALTRANVACDSGFVKGEHTSVNQIR
jgi:hypothetical protein